MKTFNDFLNESNNYQLLKPYRHVTKDMFNRWDGLVSQSEIKKLMEVVNDIISDPTLQDNSFEEEDILLCIMEFISQNAK